MPRNHGKVKIQWIVQKAARNATFRKRCATLLEKAKKLSVLCQIPVAMVVYGPDNAEPAFWPENLDEAKGIMRSYLELPEASKETQRLNNEGFLRNALKKMRKRFETYKATAGQLEVNLILNDVSLGRRSNLDDLAPELAAAVRSNVALLRSSVNERVNSLTSAAAAVVLPPLAPEEAVAAMPVPSQEEPLMVAPLAMAPPMVANSPLFVLPSPPLDPDVLLVPPQEPLMAPSQEPLMVPPFAMAPPADVPVLVPVPHTLQAAVGDPLAPAAGVGVDDDDGFPRDGSYLLEVADAILDDDSGRQATEEDVDRLLWEHGLESFIKPKP
ncbi:hypothetical protein BDA96_09G038100 [Sorghum bicolor]|uniref:MADS-box domain-containing protein n=2 Tax=Sorghum bicolor TaxID=4558 RepID=A0A921Q793_SORBI|nr:MADS-box transcription factor 56 [Sorghum bicolor]KAG0516854.1 hypothetical protein BDA96_09G038100 [Sorghum bicolor]KXG21253.1 hypothetical protein SORBI_3009G035700 [Sorghum bicolor]|eukprot:XP_021304121.1 MADS-box transcription factor 56 [Sorghum bicolor]